MKSLLTMALVLLLTIPAIAKDLTFTWNANTEPDMKGYTLYQKVEGQNYNYAVSIINKTCIIVDGGCYVNVPAKTNDVDYTLNAPDGAITTYNFVARAYDTNGLYSGDSNEVTYVIDLAPIVAPTGFAGIYNSTTQTVDFSWVHTDSERVAKWGLFKSNMSGSGYQNVVYVENTPPVLSTSYELPYDPGATSYWVLVAYTAEGKYSPNSNELQIKLGPQAPHLLKVKIK